MLNSFLFDKLSLHARHILRASADLARANGSSRIEPRHLFAAIYFEKGSLGSFLLNSLGIQEDSLSAATALPEGKHRPLLEKEPLLSKKAKDVIIRAYSLASHAAYPYVGSEHFASALVETNDPDIRQFIASVPEEKKRSLFSLTPRNLGAPDFPGLPRMLGLSDISLSKPNPPETEDTPFLDQHGVELGIEPNQSSHSGREKEIESVLRTLGRKTKNNPLLIGEPGVGKTALVEAVAKRIEQGKAGPELEEARVIMLDLTSIVAGTSFRGEFEARIKDILHEAETHPEIILFVDEIHTIVGAGNASGGLDAANILKPALSRGNIRIIGATTLSEYKRHIEKDAALERRFQPILIEEPSHEDALRMLEESRSDYEKHHQITIGKEALRTVLSMSSRHLPERFLPDKAFDLLDEASSLLRRRSNKENNRDEKRRTLLKKQEELIELKEVLVEKQQFEEAATLRKKEVVLQETIESLEREEEKRARETRPTLSENEVLEATALITGIPLEKLRGERRVISTLFETLEKTVVGQTDALERITNAITRSHFGMGNSSGRPLGSFLFLGPSGVGKTLTAETLGKTLFSNKKPIIRFDMSEFMERHHTAQMIGAPAGYVGYGEGGKLTEHMRRHPASVILFDEIEKAHPDVLNLLLQILEDGTLTDAEGRRVPFRNSVIILTSNIGTDSILGKEPLGFGDRAHAKSFEASEESVMSEVRRRLRPELLARLDHTIVFQPLSNDSLKKIAGHELLRLTKELGEKSIKLRFTPNITDFIAKKSFSSKENGRSVRKTIEQIIEHPLASELAKRDTHPKTISLSMNRSDTLNIRIR